MIMRAKNLVALTLLAVSAGALADVPFDTSFAERYPPESITSEERAHEVIDAYDKEKQAWAAWRKEEDKLCYRKFLVNHCLSSNRETYLNRTNEAHRVWVKARDFLRTQRAEKAAADRKANEAKQAQRIKEHDARPVKAETEDAAVRHEPTVLTEEQQRANEQEYAKKQREREERIKEQQAKTPPKPSSTLEERVQERDKRRKEAAAKRMENIKKRAQKAAEYEEQLRLREQQQEHKMFERVSP